MNRRRFLRLCIGAAGSVAALGVYGRYIEPNWLSVERLTIPLDGLAAGLDGLRIAFLSDFHLRWQTSPDLVERSVTLVNSLQPDLIALGGDYVEARASATGWVGPALAGLRAPLGVYAVLGNHDRGPGAGRIIGALKRIGVTVLMNQGVALRGGALYLAGVDDAQSGWPNLPMALQAQPAGATVILLCHEPYMADQHAQDGRVALQISGDTHGGQVNLLPVRALLRLFPRTRYLQGLYRVGSMWLYVTRGVGTSIAPVRLNCRPEVTLLTLRVGIGS